jgi:peptidoglycan/xylan/chitin deacetylase (PgdA/CDA1 family)
VKGSFSHTLKGIENLRDLEAEFKVDYFFVNYKRNHKTMIFFRDDDVAELTPKLKKFVGIFIKENVPLHLSIIPKKLSKECALWLKEINKRYPHLIEFGQHGYSHKNYSKGCTKYEFGSSRSYKEQKKDIKEGRDILERIFKRKFFIFTPPFNNFNKDTLKAINELDFLVFSHDKGNIYENKYRFKDISTSINFNRKDDKERWYIPTITELLERVENNSVIYKHVGILFHHEKFRNDNDFAKLKYLIHALKSKKDIEFKKIGEVL